jgi:hemerythrin superfamily protein
VTTEQETDAVKMLTAQHKEMENLLKQVTDAEEGERKALFAVVADKLTMHIKSEEEIFYPAVHRARTEDDLLEALEEHLSLKRILADLVDMDPSDEAFDAKLHVLTEQAEHHHGEEEEKLFPAVLKMIDASQRQILGQRMLDLQEELALQGQPRVDVTDETSSAARLR